MSNKPQIKIKGNIQHMKKKKYINNIYPMKSDRYILYAVISIIVLFFIYLLVNSVFYKIEGFADMGTTNTRTETIIPWTDIAPPQNPQSSLSDVDEKIISDFENKLIYPSLTTETAGIKTIFQYYRYFLSQALSDTDHDTFVNIILPCSFLIILNSSISISKP